MPQPRTAPRRSLRSPGFCPAPLVPIPGTSHRHRLEENAAAVSRFETIDQKAATGSWHWFFLIQGRGLPEQMIGGDPEFFLRHMFGTLLHDEAAIEPAAWTEYLRCFRHPETIRATCDEYRAGASIDLVHDRADLSQKVRVPMLVLWGTHSGQGSGYDLLRVWRDHASDVRGHGIDCGHFIPEEQPDQVCAALKDFFSV